jgi:hypothetical protein
MPREEWPRMQRRLKERLGGKEENYEYEDTRKDGQPRPSAKSIHPDAMVAGVPLCQ